MLALADAVSVLATLRAGREAAERLMLDRCVVRRPTGEMVTDPDTWELVPEYVVVYDPEVEPHRGRVKVQSYEAYESTVEVAGGTSIVIRVRCDFPVGAFVAQPGDVVTLLETQDPNLAGKHYRLTSQAPFKSHATAYRVLADVNVGEEVPPWP